VEKLRFLAYTAKRSTREIITRKAVAIDNNWGSDGKANKSDHSKAFN
jgi:hypothetical protein